MDYAQQQHRQQLDHLHAQQQGMQAAQQRMMIAQQRQRQNLPPSQQPGQPNGGGGMMPPPGAQGGGGGMQAQMQQRAMQHQGNSMPPPPGMRIQSQPQGVGGGGPPLPPGPIPPSHPSHPQHQAWLAQQQRQAQEAQNHLHSQGPSNHLPQPPNGAHAQQIRMQQAFEAQRQQQQQAVGGQPNGLPAHHPNSQGGPPGSHPQMPMQPTNQSPYASLPPNQGSIAPQARSISSAVNLRNGQPPPNSNGPFAQPTSLPPNASTSQPPPSQHTQSPVSIRPPSQQTQPPPPSLPGSVPPNPNQPQLQPGQQPMQRPMLRAQMNAPNQQASLALAAHLAVHGTGPISATAVPTGTALSRLLALTDALTFALEDENPLDSLRTVVSDYFTDAGVVKFGLYDKTAQLSKVFEIPCSAFPRFQHLNLLHGVLSSTLSPSFIREYRLTTPDTTLHSPSSPSNPAPLPQVHIGYLLRADEAVWTSRFSSGTKVDLVGTLTVHLVFKDLGNGQPVLRVESFEFESRGHEEWVVREAMELLPPSTPAVGNVGIKEEESSSEKGGGRSRRSSNSVGAGGNQRKGMTTRRRSASAREEQDQDQESNASSSQPERGEKEGEKDGNANSQSSTSREDPRRGATARIPASSVGSFGVTEMGMRCLEISESVAQLQDLIAFSLETNTGPIQSLARYAERRRNSLYGPSTPAQPQQPALASFGPPPHQQPNNSFYSSVGASPHPNGVTNMGPPPQRPTTGGGGAGSPAAMMNGQGNGNGAAGELMSPVTLGPNGNGKRKLGNAPPGTPHGMEEVEMNGSEPGSPQKLMRGGGGRGRGRGR